MKKVLYSTTALAAAGMFALSGGDALAQDKPQKMKIGVSGSYKFYVGYADQESTFENAVNAHYGTINAVSDSEVHFRGNTKLDNGVRIDVIIQLETDQKEANTSGNTIDESYVKLTGGFGDLRLGSAKPAAGVLAKFAPLTGIINSLNPDIQNFVVNPTGSVLQGRGFGPGPNDDMKIVYLTPKLSGFQAGVSYTPGQTDNDNPIITAGANSGTTADGSYADIAVSYDGKIGDVTLGLGAGYWINDGTGTSDFTGWDVGAKVSMAGFTIGGNYTEKNDERGNLAAATASTDYEHYNIGIQYKTGPWAVGLTHSVNELPLAAATAGEDKLEVTMLGGTYTLGPGVTAGANVFMAEFSDETTANNLNNEGWGVAAGINVAF